MQENNNKNKRFIGKVRGFTKDNDTYYNILVDNPSPVKKDGTEDPYYKGNLIWFDKETGCYYEVKSIALRGVSADGASRGDVNSLMIDLDNTYHCKKMEM